MAKKQSRVRKTLSKEVNLPDITPDNKIGNALTKKRRIWIPKYFSESWQELKKVNWPNRKESWKLTFAVIVFTLVFTLITALADQGLQAIVERVLL